MPLRVRSIITNGLPYGLALFALSFAIGHFAYHMLLQHSLPMAALIGAAACLANGLLYKRINAPAGGLKRLSLTLHPQEQLIQAAPANYTMEDSLLPGKLFITSRRLAFVPYNKAENRQLPYSWDLSEYSWDLNGIEPVNFSRSLWNAGGGLSLKTSHNELLRFEVENLKWWKEALQRQRLYTT